MDRKHAKVIVLPCPSYEKEEVYSVLRRGIAALGGMEQFVKPTEKILVKPNFLWASGADRAIVTHPSVISGFLRILSEDGMANVLVGDSPAHGNSMGAVKSMGLEAEDLYGAVPASMTQEVLYPYPEGRAAKEFYFTKEAVEADAIIGLSKMKTHMLERVTGAVKLMYGLICGHRKAIGHTHYPNADSFARMLADIHNCVKPRLHIMDAVVAMEGNGPASGTPVDMGLLLFSADPVALDSVFCRLIDLKPTLVPTNVQGQAMGLGVYDYDRIDILTDDGEGMRRVTADELFALCGKPEFHVERGRQRVSVLGMLSSFSKRFSRRPYILPEDCIKCGTCVACCPVDGKAVSFKNGKHHIPVYDYKKCIRCYCCQEVCPQKAIRVKE